MGFYGTTKAEADSLAAKLSKLFIGKHAVLTDNGIDKTVTGYRVGPYTGSSLFGITERWTYDGRPDIGELGGAYIDLRRARALAA